MVFVASDTVMGLHLAREALGETAILSVSGLAVHSTRTLHASASSDGVKVRGTAGSSRPPFHSPSPSARLDAPNTQVLTDFLGLAVSDVLLAVGQSSFSGAAGALHGGVTRVGDQDVTNPLSASELAGLRASFSRRRAA